MSIKSSGLWCDICHKPIFQDPYWECSINGKRGHSCDQCKTDWAKFKNICDQVQDEEKNNPSGGRTSE